MQQHQHLYGFYWALQDIETFVDNRQDKKGKINWTQVDVTRNGWISFPYNKWIYLLPVKTKNKIDGESFLYYNFRMSSEAFTSYYYNTTIDWFNDTYYYNYFYTILDLNVDPLAIETTYVEQRKYSLTELFAAVGGMYSLVFGLTTLFCVHVILKRFYPHAFIFNSNMRRSLPNYLKVYGNDHET